MDNRRIFGYWRSAGLCNADLVSPDLQIPDLDIRGFIIPGLSVDPADCKSASNLVRDKICGLTFRKNSDFWGSYLVK